MAMTDINTVYIFAIIIILLCIYIYNDNDTPNENRQKCNAIVHVEVDSNIMQMNTNHIINYLVTSKQYIFNLVNITNEGKVSDVLCEKVSSVISDMKDFTDANKMDVDYDNNYHNDRIYHSDEYQAMLVKVYENSRNLDRSDCNENSIDHFRYNLVKIMLLLDIVLYLLHHGNCEGVLKLTNLNNLLLVANNTTDHKFYKHYEDIISPEINMTKPKLISGNGKKVSPKTCSQLKNTIVSGRDTLVASDNILYTKPKINVKQSESENTQEFGGSLISRSSNNLIKNCTPNNKINKLKDERNRQRKILVDENCRKCLRDDYNNLRLY
jgi:hypothetical protein